MGGGFVFFLGEALEYSSEVFCFFFWGGGRGEEEKNNEQIKSQVGHGKSGLFKVL